MFYSLMTKEELSKLLNEKREQLIQLKDEVYQIDSALNEIYRKDFMKMQEDCWKVKDKDK
jgi:hypothetical protein